MKAMRALLVLATTILLSGCAGRNGSEANDVAARSTDPAPAEGSQTVVASAVPMGEIMVHVLTGHFTGSVLYLGGVQTPNASLYFDVPANSTGIVVELRWTGDTSDFALAVFTPRACNPGPTDVALVNSVACQANWMAMQESEGIVIRDRAIGSTGPGGIKIAFAQDAIESEPCGQDVCPWRAIARDHVAVDSNFDLRASVFVDREVPEAYTAFVEP